MDFEIEMLLSNELGEDVINQMTGDEYQEKGFKVTSVKQDNYSGFKISKSYADIDREVSP